MAIHNVYNLYFIRRIIPVLSQWHLNKEYLNWCEKKIEASLRLQFDFNDIHNLFSALVRYTFVLGSVSQSSKSSIYKSTTHYEWWILQKYQIQPIRNVFYTCTYKVS